MFGFSSVKSVAAVLIGRRVASAATSLEAQSAHRTRRESNANRKARIERTIQDTYSHGGRSVAAAAICVSAPAKTCSRNNEVTWWLSGTYYLNPEVGNPRLSAGGAYGNAKVGNTIYNIQNPQISQYTFMAGPTYRVYAEGEVRCQHLRNRRRRHRQVRQRIEGHPGPEPRHVAVRDARGLLSRSERGLQLLPEPGRACYPPYLGSTWGGTIQNNLGVNVGLIYRFGRIK